MHSEVGSHPTRKYPKAQVQVTWFVGYTAGIGVRSMYVTPFKREFSHGRLPVGFCAAWSMSFCQICAKIWDLISDSGQETEQVPLLKQRH